MNHPGTRGLLLPAVKLWTRKAPIFYSISLSTVVAFQYPHHPRLQFFLFSSTTHHSSIPHPPSLYLLIFICRSLSISSSSETSIFPSLTHHPSIFQPSSAIFPSFRPHSPLFNHPYSHPPIFNFPTFIRHWSIFHSQSTTYVLLIKLC